MDPLIGRSLGQYDLIDRIGAGGMGRVYRAVHRLLRVERAVKILPPYLAEDASLVARFVREATIAAELRHPHIIRLHDIGELDGLHYLVMDLVAGRSLHTLIREDVPVDPVRAVRLLTQLADALDYAHGRGVIHRDVKPANVLVDRADQVTLLDFGIAVALQGTRMTRTGVVVGTPHYVAPEGWRGQGGTPAADRYALGVVAFELLAGGVPFSGSDTPAIMHAHIYSPPPSLRARRPELPPAVDAVIGRQLAKDPVARYPSAAGFVDALAGSLGGPRGPASPSPPRLIATPPPAGVRPTWTAAASPPAGGALGRRPTPRPAPAGRARALGSAVLVATLGLVALVVGAVLWAVVSSTGSGSQAGAARGAADPPATPAPQAAAGPPTATPPTSTPRPLGTIAPTLTGPPRPEPTAAVAVPAPPPTARPESAPTPTSPALPTPAEPISADNAGRVTEVGRLDGHGSLVTSVAFSPDGQTLASGSGDVLLWLWRVADRTLLRKVIATLIFGVWDVAFAPDGQTIVAGVIGAASHWRVDDGSYVGMFQGHDNIVFGVAFSPDGQLLASASADHTVRLWRVADHAELHALAGHTDTVVGVAFSPDGQLLASVALDHTVRLWRVADGAHLRTLEGHTDAVHGVAFSPDGQTLASSSVDTTIRLWRVADGAAVHTLTGHTHEIPGVAYSPDGRLLASASTDQTVRLWRVADGAHLHTLIGHTAGVTSVAFSPDGRTLASGSSDLTVRLWAVR